MLTRKKFVLTQYLYIFLTLIYIMPYYNNNYNNSGDDEGKDLAYDLRQTYAKIIGGHLELITQARLEDNYPKYFKALKHLYIITQHKYRHYGKQNPTEEWDKLIKDFINLSNENSQAYLGKSSDPSSISKIENFLNKIEMWLYEQNDKADIFGGKEDDDGL